SRIATAEYDIIDLERSRQLVDNITDHFAPPLRSHTQTTALANIVLVGLAVLVRHVANLHGFHVPVGDDSRTQPCAQAEKEHVPALVAAHGLHGGIVNEPHRLAECLLEIEK